MGSLTQPVSVDPSNAKLCTAKRVCLLPAIENATSAEQIGITLVEVFPMTDLAPIVNDKALVFFDLETGGINPSRHPIIQIAAVAVSSSLEPLEAIEIKVQFEESRANKHSLRKNHFSRGQWAREGVSSLKAAGNFAEFLRRHPGYTATSNNGDPYSVAQLVAHNATFDGPFLQAWFEKLGLFLPARFQVLCTLQRAHWYFAEHPECSPPRDFKLATLCDYFGVPFHAFRAHEALGDATATYLLYRHLMKLQRSRRDHGDTSLTRGRDKNSYERG